MWRTGRRRFGVGRRRWAARFDSNVTRVPPKTSDGCRHRASLVYPSFEITRAAYNVEVSFIRFDLDLSNTASLLARWRCARPEPRIEA